MHCARNVPQGNLICSMPVINYYRNLFVLSGLLIQLCGKLTSSVLLEALAAAKKKLL